MLYLDLAVKFSVVTVCCGPVDPRRNRDVKICFHHDIKAPVSPVMEGCGTSTEIWTYEQIAVIGRGQGASTLGPT